MLDLKKIKTFEELKLAKNAFFSKNQELLELKQQLKTASKEEKPLIGKKIQIILDQAQEAFNQKTFELEQEKIINKINENWQDVNQPILVKNSLHPLTIVANRFKDFLIAQGFYQTFGSQIESDEFNFSKLNIFENHPAREMQDSLYLNNFELLRTHNTGFSARELAKRKNEAFNQFSIGFVYRNDEDDDTHSHQFMQLDLLSVGKVSFNNLIWLLKNMLSYVFEQEIKLRLRPSFFPFTEPSVEIDIFYNDKWIEVMGAGMIHHNVLKMAGYTNDFTSFACGIGIDRIAMIKYGVINIREFYQNDLRFLNQFKGVK